MELRWPVLSCQWALILLLFATMQMDSFLSFSPLPLPAELGWVLGPQWVAMPQSCRLVPESRLCACSF